jgi:hypothetical protein
VLKAEAARLRSLVELAETRFAPGRKPDWMPHASFFRVACLIQSLVCFLNFSSQIGID